MVGRLSRHLLASPRRKATTRKTSTRQILSRLSSVSRISVPLPCVRHRSGRSPRHHTIPSQLPPHLRKCVAFVTCSKDATNMETCFPRIGTRIQTIHPHPHWSSGKATTRLKIHLYGPLEFPNRLSPMTHPPPTALDPITRTLRSSSTCSPIPNPLSRSDNRIDSA